MPLYELGDDLINPVSLTSFQAAGIKERGDLQRLLRDRIDVLGADLLVISEEFGDWEDARRRIDLLAVDRDAKLVVIELKRTEDGGHIELQALRYAAMISAMTAPQAVDTFGAYLAKRGKEEDPLQTLLGFLGWETLEDGQFGEDVRIILASHDFDKEITTAVLWLNKRRLDITCVRLRPYLHQGRILLDVEQIIPIREASEYQVRLREKEERQLIVRQSQRDLTRYTVTTRQEAFSALPKRRAILQVVKALVGEGYQVEAIESVLETKHRFGPGVVKMADGELNSESFISVLGLQSRAIRFFCQDDELIHQSGRTYALTSQWGAGTEEAIRSLLAAFPAAGISCVPTTTDVLQP